MWLGGQPRGGASPRRPAWLEQVGAASVRADLLAGLTGAAIVLPQAVAFSSIAGLPPQMGFATAIIPAAVAALAGSSSHAVSGPTTAISVLVYAALAGDAAAGSAEFVAAAVALAFFVGVIQVALAVGRLGALVDFVSHSVITGFIIGAALLIGLSQLQYLLGVDLPRPNNLTSFAGALFDALPQASPHAALVGGTALVFGIGLRAWRPALPNYLIALVAASAVGVLLGAREGGLAVIGPVPAGLQAPDLPPASLDRLRDYGSAALAIALVGVLEALSVARAIGVKSGQPIDGNREILGQGLANLVGSFFACYPASASFTRSGVNYDAGARTPLAAVFAAVGLLLILQLVAPLFAWVPLAAMGGVVLLVAIRLIDLEAIRHVTRSAEELTIGLVTLLAVLLIDLEFSIYVGVFLSFVFFLRRSSRPLMAVGAPDPGAPRRMFRDASDAAIRECPQLLLVRLDGPLFFGSVEFVRRQFRRYEALRARQIHMLFVVKGVGEIDLPGADLLIEEARRRGGRGGSFHLQTRSARTLTKLARFKVMRVLTRGRIHMSKGEAIATILPMLDPGICAHCTARIFLECPPPPEGGPLLPYEPEPPPLE